MVNNHPNRKKTEVAVLVTTAHRGVFFGFAKLADTDKKTISLRGARNCLSWPAANQGFLGLANMGPHRDARVGPAADIILHDVTCVAACTPAALKAWEKAEWR